MASCSSFNWAIAPNKIDFIKSLISDEYGHEYSLPHFKLMLKECPIQFFDMIGQEFS